MEAERDDRRDNIRRELRKFGHESSCEARAVLPLYDGAPRVGRLLPDSGAILRTADFPDVSALAATLRRLAAGPEPEHFRWRARQDLAPAFQRVLDMSAHKYTALCRVCAKLAADKAR